MMGISDSLDGKIFIDRGETPEEFSHELEGFIGRQEYSHRFWHVLFRHRGLSFLMLDNRVAWYVGKVCGISIGLDLIFSHIAPLKGMHYGSEHPVIWIGLPELMGPESEHIVQRFHWETYSLNELFTLIGAMMDPTLLPLCLSIEPIRKPIVSVLERL
jgi:hypothetical protein